MTVAAQAAATACSRWHRLPLLPLHSGCGSGGHCKGRGLKLLARGPLSLAGCYGGPFQRGLPALLLQDVLHGVLARVYLLRLSPQPLS